MMSYVSKKPAMPAYSNQKRAQRVRKEVLLDATAEALQILGTMVLLPLGRNSQEMRMVVHSIELDTKPLSSLCSLLCFPPDSVSIVQKHFTSEHVFTCYFWLCLIYLADFFAAVLVSILLFCIYLSFCYLTQ